MSRLPRLVSSNAEAAKIDPSESITFRLKPEDVPQIEPAPSDLGSPPPASERHFITPSPRSDAPDLNGQIEALRRSERAWQQRSMQAEAQVQAAQNWYTQQQMFGQLQQTYEQLEGGIQARTAELEQAKQDYAVALSRNDYNTAAEAQARMTATQQAIADIQNGQVELSEYAQKMQQQAQQPQQPAPQLNAQNIDQFIETQLPDLLPSEKEWLKSHPDALLDAGNQQRLNIAFHDSVRDGLKRGTPEYFRHMDRRLGYESEDYSRESSDPTSMVLEANRSKPQRRSRGGREVTLSKEERDMARLSGISEEEYGRQKLHLQDLKKSGYYTQE
jgi:hypothetical protein